MKKISDEDWERVFGLKNSDSERKEYEEFIKSVENLSVPPVKDVKEEARPFRIKIPRKANLNIDDSLDLHGLSVKEASEKLNSFFILSKEEKLRVVLVITGKGKHSKGNPSLKPFVERWFKNEGKEFVKNYGIAPKAHGGEGAFIVFLK